MDCFQFEAGTESSPAPVVLYRDGFDTVLQKLLNRLWLVSYLAQKFFHSCAGNCYGIHAVCSLIFKMAESTTNPLPFENRVNHRIPYSCKEKLLFCWYPPPPSGYVLHDHRGCFLNSRKIHAPDRSNDIQA